MYSYPLKALSKDSKELVVFTLKDGPCPISNDYFILMNRPNSPILRYDSISRGMDIEGLFEGDVISYKDDIYVITYTAGFRAKNFRSELVKIEELEDYKVVGNYQMYKEFVKIPAVINHRFKYDNCIFDTTSIFGIYEGKLLLKIKGGLVVNAEDVQQYAGFKYKGSHVYFGDEIDGGKVVFKNGICCTVKNGIYTEIVKKK